MPSTQYAIYIAAPQAAVWTALTDGAKSRLYFFGRSVTSDWRAGSRVEYRMPNGDIDIAGYIVEIDPPRLVRMRWRMERASGHDLPEMTVSFEIDPAGEACRLAIAEDYAGPVPETVLEGSRASWPILASGLKSLLETGRVPEIDLGHHMDTD